jgi:DNA-binding transcriptional LysR family regulator
MDDLEVRHCRILVAVSDHGGISAAARALGLAQSTVSEALLSLERLLGVPVTLRRPGREAVLTASAAGLLPHARALVCASEEALATMTANHRRRIRLGTVESVSTFVLPHALAAFRTQWPLMDVQVTVGLCEELRSRVRCGELDAAITVEGSGGALADESCGSRTLSPSRLCLFASSAGRPGAPKVTRRDLARRRLLLPDPDGAFNALMRSWFGAAREQPQFASGGSVDGVKGGVRTGEYVGVLANYAVASEIASGEFVEIRVQEPLPAIAFGLTMQRRPIEASPFHDMIRCIESAIGASDQKTPGARQSDRVFATGPLRGRAGNAGRRQPRRHGAGC